MPERCPCKGGKRDLTDPMASRAKEINYFGVWIGDRWIGDVDRSIGGSVIYRCNDISRSGGSMDRRIGSMDRRIGGSVDRSVDRWIGGSMI